MAERFLRVVHNGAVQFEQHINATDVATVRKEGADLFVVEVAPKPAPAKKAPVKKAAAKVTKVTKKAAAKKPAKK